MIHNYKFGSVTIGGITVLRQPISSRTLFTDQFVRKFSDLFSLIIKNTIVDQKANLSGFVRKRRHKNKFRKKHDDFISSSRV